MISSKFGFETYCLYYRNEDLCVTVVVTQEFQAYAIFKQQYFLY